MFIGEFQHNIDTKGRLAIPAKFREQLKKGAVVTRGLDNCLFIYPRSAWEKIAKKLSDLPISQSKARAFSRLMLAGAMDVDFDSQGRINLPDYLRKFANIEKKAIVAGLYDRLEVWDKQAWDKYKQSTEKESNKIAETLGELGV
ncbi:division/cell wall cluster transcriptional repressor MraZ [Candidatus Parcubacteria bacterium]|nr:division/cell wall cluster transcriptional repressor MraZ [Candidatus Parcubacteria bacterium]MCK5081991.1 division/cell wall cluster transcriptional repressor MraZ [Candidatus Omnitrophota bacterium]MCK5211882.1 division/cell wall cluster transcriptional repressor MraZ [Candidatus Parcubacteria bacterium]